MDVVLHHGSSDLSMLVRNGITIPDNVRFRDTEVAARWVYPDQTDFSLVHLALRMTDMADWRPNVRKLEMEDFENLSDEALGERCGGDAEATIRLWKKLEPEITRYQLDKIYDLAMDVMPILATIGGTGMSIDKRGLQERAVALGGPGWPEKPVSGWLADERRALETTLGIDNLNSNRQLAKALYGSKIGAKASHKTEKGEWSTDRNSVMWARYQARQRKNVRLDALLTKLLEFGQEKTRYIRYYRNWLDGPGQGTRVYSTYALGRTSTGRLSSYDENLQNIPPKIRELVVPSDGYDYIVQADFKQLELAVAAHISQDPTLLDWVRRGLDIHALQAASVLGIPQPRTKEQFAEFKRRYAIERQIGKRANFGTLYGVGAESLAWQVFGDSEGTVWIPPAIVQTYIDEFFKRFSGYKHYIDDLRRVLYRKDWIVSPFGRRWFLPSDNAGWRKAQNYPIQSTASDLTILVLKALNTILKKNKWTSRIIGEVHDSIVLETTRRELHALIKLVKRVCENPDTAPFGFTLRVPLTVEMQYGTTWGTLQAA